MKLCDNNYISQRHPILEEEVGGAPSGGGRGNGGSEAVPRGEQQAQGIYSLVGHLYHFLDGRVASHHEVFRVLLHFDTFQPLGHRTEGDAL